MLDEVVRSVIPGGFAGRVGLVVGTSSGNISGGFESWQRHGGEEEAWRQAPVRRVAARHRLFPATTVSVACASGTAAFGVGRGWLRDGECDAVVVAGVDALSLYIHAGFAGLGALARERSRVFAPDRDGLMLGEGAAAFFLEPPGGPRPAIAVLRGVGYSQDGVHVTAPDRSGSGLYRAGAAALAEAGLAAGDIGTVSAHGTGTPFNDAMEARALTRLFGGPVPLHAAKPVVGHTLGAAGAVEAALVLAILDGAEAPAPLDAGDCEIALSPAGPGAGLSVSAAFGGVNAAVVFGRNGASTLRRHRVEAVGCERVEADTFELVGLGAPPTLGRADTYVRAGIAALRPLPLSADTAVVLTSESNCRQADLRYHADLVARGPAHVSRVHFTYTTPGSSLAEAAILRGLRGPALVFCDTAERGRAEARRLVEHGVARACVALHVEAPERTARAEAVLYAAAP